MMPNVYFKRQANNIPKYQRGSGKGSGIPANSIQTALKGRKEERKSKDSDSQHNYSWEVLAPVSALLVFGRCPTRWSFSCPESRAWELGQLTCTDLTVLIITVHKNTDIKGTLNQKGHSGSSLYRTLPDVYLQNRELAGWDGGGERSIVYKESWVLDTHDWEIHLLFSLGPPQGSALAIGFNPGEVTQIKLTLKMFLIKNQIWGYKQIHFNRPNQSTS